MERYEGLLDGLRARPLEHVVRPARLVVGPGQPRPAEGLLPHHGARGLVIHVEVARGALQQSRSLVSKVPEEKIIRNGLIFNNDGLTGPGSREPQLMHMVSVSELLAGCSYSPAVSVRLNFVEMFLLETEKDFNVSSTF